MAKVLKVIVNLLLLLFVLTGAALLVPPLVGVTTAVAQGDMATNLQTGSVVYAWRTSLDELKSGDKILQTESDSVYVYEVEEVDTQEKVVTVSGSSQTKELELRSTAQKVVLTVPFIGYMSIAMQTMEGRIVLGLVALLLIVLFILAEVWCRRQEDAEDEKEETSEEEDDQYFKGLADHQRTADFPGQISAGAGQTVSGSGQAGALAEDGASVTGDTRIFPGRRSQGEQEPGKDLAEDFMEDFAEDFTEDFPEEAAGEAAEDPADKFVEDRMEDIGEDIPEGFEADRTEAAEDDGADREVDDLGLVESEAEVFIKNISTSGTAAGIAAGADTAAGEQIADEGAEPKSPDQIPDTRVATAQNFKTDAIPDVQAALEAALEQQQIQTHEAAPVQEISQEEEAEALPMEELELAMPVKTVEEYLQEAYAAGEDPIVTEDKTTGVTFVDFSECL